METSGTPCTPCVFKKKIIIVVELIHNNWDTKPVILYYYFADTVL